jgi:sporulation protein YlmC with PRC-barrel domain
MRIDLSEKNPIIAVDEAKILGKIKGVLLQDRRLVAILSSLENEYNFQISIEDVLIGPDAFVIKNDSIANIHSSNGQEINTEMNIYTCTGQRIGQITGIDVSTDYLLNGIYIEDDYIEADRISKIGNIIIVDSCTSEEDQDLPEEDNIAFLNITQEENENTTENQVETTDQQDDSYDEPIDDLPATVYSRYKYLIGKKLIHPITIADNTYPDTTIIHAELIELCIKNNCILNLIMNAED